MLQRMLRNNLLSIVDISSVILYLILILVSFFIDCYIHRIYCSFLFRKETNLKNDFKERSFTIFIFNRKKS